MGFTNSASNITQSNSLTSNSTLLSQAHEALEVLTISVHEALIPPINWSERNTKVKKHIKALNNIFSAHLSNLKDFQRPSLVDKRYRADTPRNSRKDFKLPAAEELKLRMFREATITISSALKALAKQVAATKGDYRSRARAKGLSEFLALEEKKLGYFYLFELNTLHFKIASIEGIKKLAASPNEYLENFPQYHNLNLFQMNYEFIEAFDYIRSYFPSNNLIHTYNSDFIEPLNPSGVRPLLSGVPLFNSLPVMYRQVYYDQLKGAFFVINRALSVASPSGSTYPSFYWVDINKILFPLEPEKFAPIIEDPPKAVYRKLWRGNSLIRIKAQKFLAWLADISEGELRKYFWYKDHTEILRIQREMQPIYREYINFIEQANREPAQTSTLTLSTTTEVLASGPQNNSSSTYSYISNPVSTAPIFYLNQTEQNNITDNNAADSPTTLSAESVTNQLENQGSNLTAEEKTLTSSLYKDPPTTEASSTTSLTSIKTSEPETSEASFIFTESTQNFTAANVSNSTDTSNFASNTTNNNTSSITPDTSLMEEGKTSELEDSFYFDSAINRNDSILNGTSSPYLEFANTSIIIETTTEIAVSTSPITTETVAREEEKTPEIERSFTSADSSTGISYTEATTISTVRDITTIITEMLSSSNPISLTSTIPPLKFIEESILSRVIANIISKYTQAFFALDELKFATVLKESSFKASPNITYSFIKASIIEQVNLRAVNKYLNEGITLHNYIFKEELEQSNFRYIPIKVEEILLITLQVLAKKQFGSLDYNKVKPVVEKYIQDVWSLHLYDTNILYEGYPEVSGNIAKEYKKHFTKLSLNEIQITRRFIEAIDYVSENSLRLDPLIETNREPWERYKPSIKKSRTQIYKEHFRKKAQNIFVNVIRSFSSHVNTAPRGWVRKHLYFLRNQYTHSDLLPTPEDIMYRGMPDKEIITQRTMLAKWLSTITDIELGSYFPESYREEAFRERMRLKTVFHEFSVQGSQVLSRANYILQQAKASSSIRAVLEEEGRDEELEDQEYLANSASSAIMLEEASSNQSLSLNQTVKDSNIIDDRNTNNGTFASVEDETEEGLEEQEYSTNSTDTRGFNTNNQTLTLLEEENQDNNNVTQFINPEDYEERDDNSTEIYGPSLDQDRDFHFTLEDMFNYVIATFLLKKLPGFSEEKAEAFKVAAARSDFKTLPNIVYEFVKEPIIEAVLAKCPPSARQIYYESKNFKDLIEEDVSIFEAELEKSEFKYIPIKIEKALRDLEITLRQGSQGSMDKLLKDFFGHVWSLHLFEVSEIYSGWPQRSRSIGSEYEKYFSDLNEIQLLHRFVEALAYVKENFPQRDRPEEISSGVEEPSYSTAKKASRIEFYIYNFLFRAGFLFNQENIAFAALKDISSNALITEYLVFLRTRLYPLTADGQISVAARKYTETPDIELIASSNKLATWLSTTPDEEFGRYFLENHRAQILAQRKEQKDIYQRYIHVSSLALADHHNRLNSETNSSRNEDKAKTLVTLSSLSTGSSAEIEGKPSHKLIRRERREASPSYSAENSFKVKSKKPINDNNIAIPNSASTHAGFINSFFSSLIGLAGYIVSTRVPEAQPLNNWPNIAAETSSSHEQETTAELNINPEFPDVTANLTLMAWVVGKIFDRKLSHFTAKGELTPDQRQGIKRIIHLYLLAAVKENCRTSGIGISYLNMMGIEKLSSRISSDILNGRQPNISNFSAKDLLINWRSKDPRNLQITKFMDKTKISLADITSDCSLDSIFERAGVPLPHVDGFPPRQAETKGHSFLGLSSSSPGTLLTNASSERIANSSAIRRG